MGMFDLELYKVVMFMLVLLVVAVIKGGYEAELGWRNLKVALRPSRASKSHRDFRG